METPTPPPPTTLHTGTPTSPVLTSKFGFQKTSPGQRLLTEGYIFGNVTGDGGGGAGTLVLLPRQYFVDLYNYKRKAATDPDLVCRLMFQSLRPRSLRPLVSPAPVTPASQRFNPSHCGLPELSDVKKEAYDAHCHDSGPEDFCGECPAPRTTCALMRTIRPMLCQAPS
ncbi:hypothetical protein GWK47_009126 [Chionoecetes opilio]|uniref:Uncharacterized protein n=1 Tax=Chionoecetes opilio TaxID=41210 RepID=A0A8J4XXV5_CHIOP|nr:hypothetical protein GWK47_009126 [Chionoecetes opilio]